MRIGDVPVGSGAPLALIAGINVIETEQDTLDCARALQSLAGRHELPLIFKASFDKANRSQIGAYRGPGLDEGLHILAEVKKENETLKAKIKALEDDKEKEQEVAAQAAVDKATEDGRIPPKDEDVKAKWVSILNNDPSAIMALNALPVNPAFQRVVQAKRQEDGSMDTNGEAQMRAAKEYQAKNSSSFEQAWEATRYERPQLFN